MDKNVYDIDDHSLTYGRGYVYSLQFVGRTPVESFILRRDGEWQEQGTGDAVHRESEGQIVEQ